MYDYNLLKRLYELHSPSRGEKKMVKFLRRLCEEYGATVEKDEVGNLFVTKGTAKDYPCICAHMDQVQHQHSKDFTVLKVGDIIMAYSPKSKAQQGLGADDKNGLWIALELLRCRRVLKCAFFVGEEIGCVGSNFCALDFFKNVRFCIQPDRRNGGDLITDISGRICSDDFLDAIGYKDFGYKPTNGLSTDVGTLVHRGVGVSCVNISCGYYHPHTDQECTSWSELCNALDFAKHICRLKRTYPHKYEEPKPLYYGFDRWRDFGMFGSNWRSQLLFGSRAEKVRATKDSNDRRTMRWILESEPHLTFDELWHSYQQDFHATDPDLLRPIYKDVNDELMREWNL